MTAQTAAIPKAGRSTAWEKVKALFNPVVLGVLLIDAVMILAGHLLMVAAIAGIASVLSFLFILSNFKQETRKKIITTLGSHGAWLDLIVTLVLIYIGFSVSVTMGLTAMMIGFNLSLIICMCRWISLHVYGG